MSNRSARSFCASVGRPPCSRPSAEPLPPPERLVQHALRTILVENPAMRVLVVSAYGDASGTEVLPRGEGLGLCVIAWTTATVMIVLTLVMIVLR